MIKCPKCKGKPAFLTEVWKNHSIEFDINEKGEISQIGILEPGFPDHVEATCGICGYKWRLRNIAQITDLKTKYGEYDNSGDFGI